LGNEILTCVSNVFFKKVTLFHYISAPESFCGRGSWSCCYV